MKYNLKAVECGIKLSIQPLLGFIPIILS